MSKSRRTIAIAIASALVLVSATASTADAASGEPTWRLEQPLPPAGPPSAPGSQSQVPIGLGRIGAIEFWAPNRGLLITAGNPPTIPPGLWAYNGQQWHELATVCGATEGRIAWVGSRPDLPVAPEKLARHVHDLAGAWLTPGLIDCHTHLVYAGDRAR